MLRHIALKPFAGEAPASGAVRPNHIGFELLRSELSIAQLFPHVIELVHIDRVANHRVKPVEQVLNHTLRNLTQLPVFEQGQRLLSILCFPFIERDAVGLRQDYVLASLQI